MITTAKGRRPSLLAIALALSLLLHVVAFVLYAGYAHRWLAAVHRASERKPPAELVATSDRITLEKRTRPRAARRLPPSSPLQPAQRPAVRPPVPEAVPQPPHPGLVHARPRQPAPHPEVARITPRAQTQPAAPAARPPEAERQPANRLSPEQIAALTQSFQQTIARAQADATNVRPPKQRPTTMKRYAFVMAGKLADLTSAQGDVRVLQSWRDRTRGLNAYYVRVYMVYADGTSELVDIPWEVDFPIGHDPLATHEIFHHIPDPPKGYVLPHPFQLSRLLCIYYHDACQAVIDAEQRNGGAPASN